MALAWPVIRTQARRPARSMVSPESNVSCPPSASSSRPPCGGVRCVVFMWPDSSRMRGLSAVRVASRSIDFRTCARRAPTAETRFSPPNYTYDHPRYVIPRSKLAVTPARNAHALSNKRHSPDMAVQLNKAGAHNVQVFARKLLTYSAIRAWEQTG